LFSLYSISFFSVFFTSLRIAPRAGEGRTRPRDLYSVQGEENLCIRQ
jgi:hypothetical protein